MMFHHEAIWAIAALTTAGVIIRPFRVPEWVWAVSGAGLLVVTGLIPVSMAGSGILKGGDVYLFLIGMMLLSETARVNGLFDWIATWAVNHAAGSTTRLFTLVYLAGVVVTTFMSNDATAVVLTPAVLAVATRAKADPLPLLFACALIANAASFVLPVSNPANLVLYNGTLPALGSWMASFALPSMMAIVTTYLVLRLVERKHLRQECTSQVEQMRLSVAGRASLAGIVLTAVLLVTISAFDLPLGLPTALAGVATALGVSAQARRSPLTLVREISWGVLPLVAGLFVLVEAINCTGLIGDIARMLRRAAQSDPMIAAFGSGSLLAFVSNLMNNLPAGLIASEAVAQAHPPRLVVDNLLIGVDLGPNLSVTGSLATILWLQVIRRGGQDVGFLQFLKIGAVAMPVALLSAFGARFLMG
ncbi:arsenic transporter [Komagataeibacter medellinensis]|uniref:Arsenical membrane pump protein n=1 Tax=Komagataeibacter medellinensis (strain NBRC 3288 / BCRC 11682 / LMG 1693 / Kondo 51) TaxID=634177 RepID=G2I1F6_KOMMN|nr:arsenic transporter [Komagataeibacter medellinensis]BAK84764.1 arsenical membrane pump protein [Komagataeibacter medellinensis NBRC 3288]